MIDDLADNTTAERIVHRWEHTTLSPFHRSELVTAIAAALAERRLAGAKQALQWAYGEPKEVADPATLLARTETELARVKDEREGDAEAFYGLGQLVDRLTAELDTARGWAKTWKALCKWYWTHGHIAGAPRAEPPGEQP